MKVEIEKSQKLFSEINVGEAFIIITDTGIEIPYLKIVEMEIGGYEGDDDDKINAIDLESFQAVLIDKKNVVMPRPHSTMLIK